MPEQSVPVVDKDGKNVSNLGKKDEGNPAPGSEAAKSNPVYGVGGTAEDGGLSTEATVDDGGANAPEKDGTYKPS